MVAKNRQGRGRPRKKFKRCIECGRKIPYSKRSNLCINCALKRVHENIKQQREKYGEYYERYKKGMLLYLKRLEANDGG